MLKKFDHIKATPVRRRYSGNLVSMNSLSRNLLGWSAIFLAIMSEHYPLVIWHTVAVENGHLHWVFLLKIVIFHSYVKLPEGTLQQTNWCGSGWPNTLGRWAALMVKFPNVCHSLFLLQFPCSRLHKCARRCTVRRCLSKVHEMCIKLWSGGWMIYPPVI